MDLDTLWIIQHCWKHGAPFGEITDYLRLNGSDRAEAALYLCDQFGADAVFPPKRSWRKLRLALT